MIANADLLDYDDDEDEENHLNYNIGNQQPNAMTNDFYDYKMSSKNSFGDASNDYIMASGKLQSTNKK